MPEGDSVRRAAEALEALVGERLSVRAVHPRARSTGVAERVDGRVLRRVTAHGKHLFLEFDGPLVLWSHLGMTGSWRVAAAGEAVRGSPWLVLRAEHRQAVLRGGARLGLTARPRRSLGPDILAEPFDGTAIIAALRAADPAQAVGEALLDQRLVSGIGNVWRSEALWAARVNPWRRLGELPESELESILTEAHRLMRVSVGGGGRPRRVYRCSGRPCARCGTPIASARLGEQARIAYWCPSCQPLLGGDGAAGA